MVGKSEHVRNIFLLCSYFCISFYILCKYSTSITHQYTVNRLSTRLCEKKGFFKRFDFQKKKVFATKKKVFRAKWIAF